MVFSWSVPFWIMPSLDRNLIPFRGIFILWTTKIHMDPFREKRESDEALKCCVWPCIKNSVSNLKNGRVRYHDGTANWPLATGLADWLSHRHDIDIEALGSVPWWLYFSVVRTCDEPRHSSQRFSHCCRLALLSWASGMLDASIGMIASWFLAVTHKYRTQHQWLLCWGSYDYCL